ncbi:transcriptional regulator [Synechococcus sp. PCC 7502]|uniref:MarR family winged helix-turn-helix transcriptional regulator n=1 Tax=Synechococcus sp. PCC 7502 TaxID=1173263 RepID=UPI00029FEC7A|nr:MarR family transcriptional regulator [Synechococcus sp. PCC 7502]AFY72825.1 transcriptional regulator [Synechococcus sp. PCC 7502]
MNPEQLSEPLASEQCANKVMEVLPVVMKFLRAEMRSHKSSSLSVPQFRALAFLHLSPGSSLSDLAEHLGVTKATASAMAERLVQRDLITRLEHPQQRRQVVLTLTAEGLTLLQESRQFTRNKIADILSQLPPQELQAVETGLAKLGNLFMIS